MLLFLHNGVCLTGLCFILDSVVAHYVLFDLLLRFLFVWTVIFHIVVSEFRLLWLSQFDSVVLQWLECPVVLQCF